MSASTLQAPLSETGKARELSAGTRVAALNARVFAFKAIEQIILPEGQPLVLDIRVHLLPVPSQGYGRKATQEGEGFKRLLT